MVQRNIEPVVEDVLQLLVYVVTADAKIHQDEIDSFLAVSEGLGLSEADGTLLGRGWLFDWFLQNCEQIREDTASSEFSTNLVHLFIRLRAWPQKKRLLGALTNIAAADGDIHLNEKVLIAMAADYWDAEKPEMPELE